MKRAQFEELLESVRQGADILAGRRKPSRVFEVVPKSVKSLRGRVRLSQKEFADLVGVELSTLRNWEQGRRKPTGPAKALLRAIENDPENVLRALAGSR